MLMARSVSTSVAHHQVGTYLYASPEQMGGAEDGSEAVRPLRTRPRPRRARLSPCTSLPPFPRVRAYSPRSLRSRGPGQGEVDGASDLYSVGIILYELFTPFCTAMERVVKLREARPRVKNRGNSPPRCHPTRALLSAAHVRGAGGRAVRRLL